MEIRNSFQTRQNRSLAMTPHLRQAINLLCYRNLELSDHLVSLALTNPHIVVMAAQRASEQHNWLDLLMSAQPPVLGDAPHLPLRTASPAGQPRDGFTDAVHQAVAPPAGLMQHVSTQLNILLRDPAEIAVGHAFAAALEPSGWLSCGPVEIARDCGCTVEQAAAVLRRLQQMEPAGLFARSLAECLRLQAADAGILAPDFERLLDNLPVLARGEADELARRCGCDSERLQQMVRQLRSMNPKPGAAFDDLPLQITEPDLIVRRGPKGWLVDLNRSTLPTIEVRETHDGAGGDAQLRDARWLQNAVSRRNVTTLRIAEATVSRQGAFLQHGAARIEALSFADVAEMIGVHQSTVSRVTSGLFVATPRGTVRFRDFFSAALATNSADQKVATGSVLHDLTSLVAAEDPQNPLRDEDIARHFRTKGVTLARRTVAKYRGLLNIPASSSRKKGPRQV